MLNPIHLLKLKNKESTVKWKDKKREKVERKERERRIQEKEEGQKHKIQQIKEVIKKSAFLYSPLLYFLLNKEFLSLLFDLYIIEFLIKVLV